MANNSEELTLADDNSVNTQAEKPKRASSDAFLKIFLGMLFVWLVLRVFMPNSF